MELYLIHDADGKLDDAIVEAISETTYHVLAIRREETGDILTGFVGCIDRDREYDIEPGETFTRLRADTITGALIEMGWF